MANFKTVFYDSESRNKLHVFCNSNNEILISIEDPNSSERCVNLDRSTAIKLSKVLRAEIAKLPVDGE